MRAILYVGHGTRSKKGAAEAKQFLRNVIEQTPSSIQEISFLELTHPFIEEGFELCIKKGATEITVVPLFLLAAGHIKNDIPEALTPLKEKYPNVQVKVAGPFGVQHQILDAIAELVKEKAGELNGQEAILIVGRGSSDPVIHEAFAMIREGLEQRLGIKHSRLCYLAATAPTFQEGIESITHETKGRVIVIPYLLFGGLLLNEIKAEVKSRQKNGYQILHTDCLSRHPVIRNIVIACATGKEGEYATARY